jgi:hypothetical protein
MATVKGKVGWKLMCGYVCIFECARVCIDGKYVQIWWVVCVGMRMWVCMWCMYVRDHVLRCVLTELECTRAPALYAGSNTPLIASRGTVRLSLPNVPVGNSKHQT